MSKAAQMVRAQLVDGAAQGVAIERGAPAVVTLRHDLQSMLVRGRHSGGNRIFRHPAAPAGGNRSLAGAALDRGVNVLGRRGAGVVFMARSIAAIRCGTPALGPSQRSALDHHGRLHRDLVALLVAAEIGQMPPSVRCPAGPGKVCLLVESTRGPALRRRTVRCGAPAFLGHRLVAALRACLLAAMLTSACCRLLCFAVVGGSAGRQPTGCHVVVSAGVNRAASFAPARSMVLGLLLLPSVGASCF